ncbi:hypothetical protein A2230_05375 [candidate division WOR-1 bacterium RIFOXYA2_FULL_36_21]|uniref:Transporter n=1 Tax=candidate division WOR-1 bacterium RIFOXYB2_FULL_36_35 TaxID=1802578 RepID=A0A1F4S4X8_UNCSA|nr:MAG: hypothetical protein A2230_05375 [candidate division WOR-1 bacterium RIFOXYA2_FULL_36_21]OGC14512.1 MAG: hypothetical protein A2282_09435 [candidate division WOR-1 bacterium RIFOXYA12_FULL_36_13]OGC15491.1 MAG: hypothetical protein A2290_03770 [candidate division WOR-1 bacterium RIFOXYB2_FULL_36_35]
MKKLIGFILILFFSSSAFALNLKESIKIATDKNPSVITARKVLEAASGQAFQAMGAFFPNIKIEASTGQIYSKPYQMVFTTNVGGIPATQSFIAGVDEQIPVRKLGFSLVQPFFTGGKLTSQLRLAQNNYEITLEELNKTILSVSFDTTVAYYGLIRAVKLVQLSEQAYNMAKNHLEKAKTMFSTGISTKSDVLRAEVQNINAEITLSKAKNSLIIAQNSLNSALGYPFDHRLEVEYADLSNEISLIPPYENILEAAYENRPEWKEFLLTKKTAHDNLEIAKSDLFPSVFAIGTYNSDYTQYPSYFTDVNSWSALISASWNILDMTLPGKIQKASADLDAQRANENSVKNSIALETRNAFSELKSTKETIQSTEKALKIAEENYKVANIRYSAGVGINLQVIDAEVALTQARIDNLDAQVNLQIAKAKLNKLVGKEII